MKNKFQKEMKSFKALTLRDHKKKEKDREKKGNKLIGGRQVQRGNGTVCRESDDEPPIHA